MLLRLLGGGTGSGERREGSDDGLDAKVDRTCGNWHGDRICRRSRLGCRLEVKGNEIGEIGLCDGTRSTIAEIRWGRRRERTSAIFHPSCSPSTVLRFLTSSSSPAAEALDGAGRLVAPLLMTKLPPSI